MSKIVFTEAEAIAEARARGKVLRKFRPTATSAACEDDWRPKHSIVRHEDGVWCCAVCLAAWTEIAPPSEAVEAAPAEGLALHLQFQELEIALRGLVPEGRELALALTKLEECALWAAIGAGNAENKSPGLRAYGELRAR